MGSQGAKETGSKEAKDQKAGSPENRKLYFNSNNPPPLSNLMNETVGKVV
jgi:hypothetical protein